MLVVVTREKLWVCGNTEGEREEGDKERDERETHLERKERRSGGGLKKRAWLIYAIVHK